MGILKKYNSITSQWEPVAFGTTGYTGSAGTAGSNGFTVTAGTGTITFTIA